MSSIKKNTTKSLFWSFLDSFGTYLLKFGFSVAIARALSPSDYGLMGMIVIFISLGQMLMMSGFSMALVQKTDTTQEDYSTVFWYNLGIGCLIYIILFFTAGSIADFYGNPILKSVTRITSLGIIFNSLAVVQIAILTKQLDFRRQALVNLVSALVSGISGVLVAYRGYAVWALVIQTLSGGLTATIGFWIVSNWRPDFVFARSSFTTLNRYGWKILAQGLGDVIFTKIYFPLIGKYFTPDQLGYYSNANRFYDIFVRQVSNAFSRVMFSAFSLIQNERERVKRNYLTAFEILLYCASILSLVLIFIAKPFVMIFLTQKWAPAVPLMIIFLTEGFFFPLLMLNHNILCSLGMSGASLKIDILKKILTFGSIFIAFGFGVRALIAGQVAGSFIAFTVSVYVVFRHLGLSITELIKKALPIIMITTVCFVVSYFVIDSLFSSDWTILLANIILMPAVYFGLSYLFRVKALTEIRSIVADFVKGRKDG